MVLWSEVTKDEVRYILPTFKEICENEVLRIGRINNLHLSRLCQSTLVLHTVWCHISGEAAGKIDIDHSSE